MMQLLDHRYGKSRVRVLKILREAAMHTIKEIDVAIALEGDFETSYTQGDNSKVVATDTIKNTVNVLAQQHLGADNEPFAVTLAQHFCDKYPQVHRATVEVFERVWSRMKIGGADHPHSFTQAQTARPFTRVRVEAGQKKIESGIADMLVLKSTASGFAGYPRSEFTTLPETNERIMATSFTATWTFGTEPANYGAANRMVLDAMLEPFAKNFSPSVQTTLFEMGSAALAACAEITRIHLAMPNQHCLPIDLKPFGLENRHEVFVPTTEPHGQIEATITR